MSQPRNLPIPDRIKVLTPAVGADWVFTNQDGGLILVRSVLYQLGTSAVVANRVTGLTVNVDGAPWLRTTANTSQVASLTRTYCAFGSASFTVDNGIVVILPWREDGVLLRQGHTLGSVSLALDAGDQYTGIQLDVLRFLPTYDNPQEPYVGGYAVTS